MAMEIKISGYESQWVDEICALFQMSPVMLYYHLNLKIVFEE